MAQGKLRPNRTGDYTIGLFGERIEVDLRQGFPLLTTKRVYWNGVVRELLWFLSGSVNAKELAAKGVHIWDGNTSRAALDARGLDYPEGIAGPNYSWQWRSFGADYAYEHGYGYTVRSGVDQITQVIREIKRDPTGRRHIVTAWNPMDIDKMALPPCHVMFQFYVDDGELSCQMYQRSVDVALGLPFNIASYSLLTHMVAHVTGLRVGRLIIAMGDTHIYQNHLDGIREQIQREPRALPALRIRLETDDIDMLKEEHIELLDYNPHPPLSVPMPMAV
jgi:thymidylate synthase